MVDTFFVRVVAFAERGSVMVPRATTEKGGLPFVLPDENTQRESVQSFLYPVRNLPPSQRDTPS